MDGVKIRTLRHDDAARLLEFERAHRHWFEQHIEPRGDAFYSPDGVREHIAGFLDAHAAGCFHPCVLTAADGAIIGRANLKNIVRHAGSAEIGYRIAQDRVGQGLATLAVHHLIALAGSSWQLSRLTALVRVKNAASARVLEKCGFARSAFAENGLWRYDRLITPSSRS